jgi:hypothetical protein
MTSKFMKGRKRNRFMRFVEDISDDPAASTPSITGAEIADLLNAELAAKGLANRVAPGKSEENPFNVSNAANRCAQCFGPPDGTEYLLPIRGGHCGGSAVLHPACWQFFRTWSVGFVDREAHGKRKRNELLVTRDDEEEN